MRTKPQVDNDKEMVAVLGDAMDAIDSPNDPDEVNAFLKECGHDPEEVGLQTSAFVGRLITRSRSHTTACNESDLEGLRDKMCEIYRHLRGRWPDAWAELSRHSEVLSDENQTTSHTSAVERTVARHSTVGHLHLLVTLPCTSSPRRSCRSCRRGVQKGI
jgi:hypothetical protein